MVIFASFRSKFGLLRNERLMKIVTGAGKGVDLIDPNDGAVLVRNQTNFTVQNFAWTGAD